MVTVEQASELAKRVEALALPHASEIISNASGFLFHTYGVVKAEHVALGNALYNLISKCCFYDSYIVYGEEFTEMVLHENLVDDDGEPIFHFPKVVRKLCCIYKDRHDLWSVSM